MAIDDLIGPKLSTNCRLGPIIVSTTFFLKGTAVIIRTQDGEHNMLVVDHYRSVTVRPTLPAFLLALRLIAGFVNKIPVSGS